MNICIVTVYRSENCGSYLQAHALYNKIKELGYNVTLFKINRKLIKYSSHSYLNLIKRNLRPLSRFNFPEIRLRTRMYFEFDKYSKKFSIIKDKEENIKKIDCFILGSDTIWNIDNKYFNKARDVYWGMRFKGKKILSYAASAGNTTFEDVNEFKELQKALENMAHIGVRDKHTEEIVKKLANRQAELVCDPTLLYDKDKYDEILEECPYKKFILIYCFEEFKIESKQKIIKFARERNLKIISFGVYRKWCDKSVVYNPVKFLGYYKNADYIMTNTFHGTIFSIIYRKKFLSFAFGKLKIVDLLQRLELNKHIVSEEDDFIPILESDIQWHKTDLKLKEWRKLSLEYLKNSIEN